MEDVLFGHPLFICMYYRNNIVYILLLCYNKNSVIIKQYCY